MSNGTSSFALVSTHGVDGNGPESVPPVLSPSSVRVPDASVSPKINITVNLFKSSRDVSVPHCDGLEDFPYN